MVPHRVKILGVTLSRKTISWDKVLCMGQETFKQFYLINIMWSDKYGRRGKIPVGPILAIYLDFFDY